MRNKFLLKQSEAAERTSERMLHIDRVTPVLKVEETTFSLSCSNSIRDILCAAVCVLKLVNALFLWKLVRALKLKQWLFCVDKFKYKTNYRCTLNDDPWARNQDKTRARANAKRKEKKRKKALQTKDRKSSERRVEIQTQYHHHQQLGTHTTLSPSSSEVLSFFKVLSYCVQTFPIPPLRTYIRVFQTRRSKWRLMRLFLYASRRVSGK